MKVKKIFGVLIGVAIALALMLFFKEPSYPNSYNVTDISKELPNFVQDFSGAALVNLDAEPDLELFVSGHGSKNIFLKRTKSGFESIVIPELQDDEGYTFSVTACDIDKDGRDEILLINRPSPTGKSASRIVKYENDKWSDILHPDQEMVRHLATGYSATCIDRKGDGTFGLVVSNENGRLMYLEKHGETIVDVASQIGLSLVSKGRSVLGVPGPKGLLNIFVGNENGANFYFVNNGDGTFEERAKEVELDDPNFNARGVSTMDLNHDDIPDLVYSNNFGPIRILEQKRDGKFEDKTPENMRTSYAVNAAVVGDFNLDGYEDLYLNNIRGSNRLFARYEDRWFLLDLPTLEETEMYGVTSIAGDLDGNAGYEIFNTHGDGKAFPNTLYTFKPESYWVQFSIKFKNGGYPRGATLRLRTSQRDIIRVISTGSGRFANYHYDQTFGLRKDEGILSLSVTLPSGKTVTFTENLKVLTKNNLILP